MDFIWNNLLHNWIFYIIFLYYVIKEKIYAFSTLLERNIVFIDCHLDQKNIGAMLFRVGKKTYHKAHKDTTKSAKKKTIKENI